MGTAPGASGAKPQHGPDEAERRRRREYDELLHRRERMRRGGFIYGTVEKFLGLTDSEREELARWRDAQGWPPSREFVWRKKARRAAKLLTPSHRMQAGKLLHVILAQEQFRFQRRELGRSGLFAHEWRNAAEREKAGPLVLVGKAHRGFLLLDLSSDESKEHLLALQRHYLNFTCLGPYYPSVRTVAAGLAADIDRILAMPDAPKRVPPLRLPTTVRPNRAPLQLDISPTLRGPLRKEMMLAWKQVREEIQHAQKTARKGKRPSENALLARFGRPARNRILNDYMETRYGLKKAANMLQVEEKRARRYAVRARQAAELLGDTVQCRSFVDLAAPSGHCQPGDCFEFSAIVMLDEAWRIAKTSRCERLSFAPVESTHLGKRARWYFDLVLAAGGYYRNRLLPDEVQGMPLLRVEGHGPMSKTDLVVSVCRSRIGSKFMRCAGLIDDLVRLRLLRTVKEGPHIRYALGDGPFTWWLDLPAEHPSRGDLTEEEGPEPLQAAMSPIPDALSDGCGIEAPD